MMVDRSGVFRPMLFPNDEVKLEDIKGTYLVSTKLDGIRCLVMNGELLSRTMKPIRNEVLREKLKPVAKLTELNQMILDGELYGEGMSFQDITSQVMSLSAPVSPELKFYCFDMIDLRDPLKAFKENAFLRYLEYEYISKKHPDIMVAVEQRKFDMPEQKEDVQKFYEENLKKGYEGLIFKEHHSKYHQGRISAGSRVGYKYKPFMTWDCKVIGVKQATEVRPEAEKKTDAFGYSKTSRKKDDRVPISRAGALLVDWNGKELLVSLALTNEEKAEIWQRKHLYIGKTIELKGMLVGSKDLPRHPVFVRFRPDKDE